MILRARDIRIDEGTSQSSSMLLCYADNEVPRSIEIVSIRDLLTQHYY